MRKFFSYSLLLIILIGFGYWLGSSTILEGTKISDTISLMENKLKDNPLVLVEESPDISEQEQSTSVDSTSKNDLTENDEIDVAVVEKRMLELLNDLRSEVGVAPVSSNDQLKKAANIRAIETEESFSHTRPDGKATFTVLEEPEVNYSYRLAGENLAMGTNYLSEKEMTEWLFKGLKDSPGHYENMIKNDFEEVGIGVHYDGTNLYIVQIFGTPL
ncbi:MAG: CAP domain-containing protein [Carnobacterium sp.]|uniref:CAP domain-containing protein n=1 Tax=Carnobacterium sp. TaxID=48221 RepID=UPI00331493A0